MIVTLVLSTVLASAVAPPARVPAFSAPLSAQAATQATAADVAPFLGDWVLTLQGPNGPGTFGLSIKVEKEKPTAELTSETMPKQVITDIAMDKKSVNLSYTFTYEGMPVDAVVSLTPGDDGKMGAQIDFAGGAYIMSGTAAKKEAAK